MMGWRCRLVDRMPKALHKLNKLGVVQHVILAPRRQRQDGQQSAIQGHPQLQSKVKDSLGRKRSLWMRLCERREVRKFQGKTGKKMCMIDHMRLEQIAFGSCLS